MRFAWLLALGACGGAADSHWGSDAEPTYDEPPYVPWDAPPPLVDAGAPKMSCNGHKADQCPLPPSQCVDANWLVYYTGASCVDHVCQFTKELVYCYAGCLQTSYDGYGGCSGGFT